MREIRMSGLMSGEGKRARTTGSRHAPLLDSTDQGQEAAHSRRHPRPADPRHRARRRHSGSRWWRVGDGATMFGLYPFLLKLYADGGYQGPVFRRAVSKIMAQVNVEIVKR